MASTLWTQGMTPETKEEFLKVLSLEKDSVVYNRLLEIIKIKKASLEAVERGTETYSTPNWAYLQAHNNGARQTLLLIENLMKEI